MPRLPALTKLPACVLLFALGGCGSGDLLGRSPPPAVADTQDDYGELQVVTHTSHYRLANSDGWGETRHWSLRHRGRDLLIDSRGGMFGDQPLQADTANAVFVLGQGADAELIVNVGDPNNSSAFHALRVVGGVLTMPLICMSSGGDNSVAWLDGPDARRGSDGLYAGPQYRHLQGGRFLLLGSRCVYDSRERRSFTVPDAPEAHSLWDSVAALGLSPDGRSLVRFGSWRDADGNEQPRLLVADLETGSWSVLPIDRRRMRYAHHEQLDSRWLDHHFEWVHQQGRDRLIERAQFSPLPRRGYYLHGVAEYRLDDINVGHAAQLGEFLVTRFQAKPLPGDGSALQDGRYQLQGETVHAIDSGYYVASSGKPYFPGQPGDPALQRQLIERIGTAFDEELASGRLDHWFE